MAAYANNINRMAADALAQTALMVVGAAPAMAMGSLFITLGASMAMAAANAVYAQQQAFILHQTATLRGVAYLLG